MKIKKFSPKGFNYDKALDFSGITGIFPTGEIGSSKIIEQLFNTIDPEYCVGSLRWLSGFHSTPGMGLSVHRNQQILKHLYGVPEGETVVISCPEAFLHPGAHANLADVFIDVMKTRDLQVIFESHSEKLLHRLMRRIAEEKISAGDVSMFCCKYNILERLDIDEYGNILNWPPDFFGDDFTDISERTLNHMRRQTAADLITNKGDNHVGETNSSRSD